jgi:hypothetical protein
MSSQPAADHQHDPAPNHSVRPVVEHALTDYGYSPDTARTLVDRLIAEGRGE